MDVFLFQIGGEKTNIKESTHFKIYLMAGDISDESLKSMGLQKRWIRLVSVPVLSKGGCLLSLTGDLPLCLPTHAHPECPLLGLKDT